MVAETIIWLLFLINPQEYKDPIGIYTTKQTCITDGKDIEEFLGHRFKCKKATPTIIKYLAGQCLGDNSELKRVLGDNCKKGEADFVFPERFFPKQSIEIIR